MSADYEVYQYIDDYKDIAIAEMHRTGVPASIKLAQGMHESGLGKSALAVDAKNHFGIKCKKYWMGRKYYHIDDDYDDRGKLTESCFRAYSNEMDSYIDHSNFLKMRKHYAVLFTYPVTDFKKWAFGLKKCGYATDKRYSQKLINKIEKYNLNQLDYSKNPFLQINSN